jgi:hypothetical protein
LHLLQVDGVSIEAQHTGDDAMPLDCSEAIMFGQELMLKIQEIIYEFEGSVNKMMIDDKGQVRWRALLLFFFSLLRLHLCESTAACPGSNTGLLFVSRR